MRILKLAMAAALAFGTIGAIGAPAAAQGSYRGEYRSAGERHGMGRDDYRRHRGWRNHHRASWHTRRVCRTYWRHHHRHRVCRLVRYRR